MGIDELLKTLTREVVIPTALFTTVIGGINFVKHHGTYEAEDGQKIHSRIDSPIGYTEISRQEGAIVITRASLFDYKIFIDSNNDGDIDSILVSSRFQSNLFIKYTRFDNPERFKHADEELMEQLKRFGYNRKNDSFE